MSKAKKLAAQQVYTESEGFSFTFTDAEDYAASEKWQKMPIFILIIVNFISVSVAQLESQIGKLEIAGSIPTYVSHGMAYLTEDYACAVFLGGFTSYLPYGWSVNLQAIENCIFSIRSIERNMRPILRTV